MDENATLNDTVALMRDLRKRCGLGRRADS
jgi:hypothetical protein